MMSGEGTGRAATSIGAEPPVSPVAGVAVDTADAATPAAPATSTSPGILFIFSAPSGAGKDTVIQHLKNEHFALHYAITCTTRPMRHYESEGNPYYFLTSDEFADLRERGELLEHAHVHGYDYGVPRGPVRAALARGEDVLLKIDVQGARTVKNDQPDAVLIYLLPPSAEESIERMRQRNTETEAELATRIRNIERELNSRSNFDYIVENPRGQVERAVAKVKAIVIAERCRVTRRRFAI